MVTMFVSVYWQSLLSMMGYTASSGESLYPDVFNPLMFIGSLVLTAVLPAICEEFIMRGNFLNSLRHNFKSYGAVVLASVAFGLFHQNIDQLFYTAVFGGLAAFLVIKTGSVFPAMVVHFVNNTLSVLIGYADNYGWGLARFVNGMFELPPLLVLLILLLLGGGIVTGGIAIIIKQSKKVGSHTPILRLYKPSLRENAWYVGAIAAAAAATVFTFIFGLLY
jgi:membrane protease YdiL (CAAX protease family)